MSKVRINDLAREMEVKSRQILDILAELGLGAGKDRPYIETYQGKLIDAKGAKGRYVRLYSKGNTTSKMNHYIEVEVFGKPAA